VQKKGLTQVDKSIGIILMPSGSRMLVHNGNSGIRLFGEEGIDKGKTAAPEPMIKWSVAIAWIFMFCCSVCCIVEFQLLLFLFYETTPTPPSLASLFVDGVDSIHSC